MSTVLTERMSLAEFHNLSNDPDVERELLFGELVERPTTKRNRWHANSEAAVAGILRNWNRSRSPRPGKVYSGEIGCDLPVVDSGVGIDVAFFSNEVLDAQEEDAKYIVGPPVLAVEILSLSDVVEDVLKTVKVYLAAGVQLVWIIDPYQRTLTVYAPNARPQMLAEGQDYCGDPHLPGLKFSIDELFD
ncbi:MAG: Uma2 family endonuclease [Planctomycetaceae bacterium]